MTMAHFSGKAQAENTQHVIEERKKILAENEYWTTIRRG